MKKLSFFFLISIFVVSCAKEDQEQQETNQELVSIEEIHAAVEKELAEGKVFYWDKADDNFVWSAGMYSDAVFSIGYTIDPSFDFESRITEVDIKSSEWQKAKNEVLQIILENESISRENPNLTGAELMPYGEEEFFPHLIVELTNPKSALGWAN